MSGDYLELEKRLRDQVVKAFAVPPVYMGVDLAAAADRSVVVLARRLARRVWLDGLSPGGFIGDELWCARRRRPSRGFRRHVRRQKAMARASRGAAA